MAWGDCDAVSLRSTELHGTVNTTHRRIAISNTKKRPRCKGCNKFLSDLKVWQGRKTCDTRCAYQWLVKLQALHESHTIETSAQEKETVGK